MKITVERMTGLLKAAEKAHAEFEKRNGRRDENWAEWYAGFIVQSIGDPEVVGGLADWQLENARNGSTVHNEEIVDELRERRKPSAFRPAFPFWIPAS